MINPSVYIPMDRLHAMARGQNLPDRTSGTALMADISGFTPLTEALANELGPLRGAEELTVHLNKIYDGLINDLERYRGVVIGFSGDAITCWFEGDPGIKACACALTMQQTMQQFQTVYTPSGAAFPLAIKVAVAAGEARRFRVGDPLVLYYDILAGSTLDRLAEAEHQANRGEVVVCPVTLSQVGDQLLIQELREHAGVVQGLKQAVEEDPWPPLDQTQFTEDQVRPWILPATYERLRTGQEFFQAELRPAVALFLRFQGIDYDHDEEAGEKLDKYIQWVQCILTRFDGALLQITVGDKGSYLYAVFGAPVAHEDDCARAAMAALDLRMPPEDFGFIKTTQIGVSKGRMRVGPYGSSCRRTYGALGDHTNLAARLMQNAGHTEVLFSQSARQDIASSFRWDEGFPLKVKGKSEPIQVYKLLGMHPRQPARVEDSQAGAPLIGRESELNLIDQKIDQALRGQGQVVTLTAGAGLGKSRLLKETVQRARIRQMGVFSGEAQSFGAYISYLPWRTIWQDFFNLNPDHSLEEQLRDLRLQLAAIRPGLQQRLPLLGVVLNLPIPENSFTAGLDPKLRKESLESLLADCIRSRARSSPFLLVLDDCQWMDSLSTDLLEVIGRAVYDLPVLILLAYRPGDSGEVQDIGISSLPHCTRLPLSSLSAEDGERLITLKLEQDRENPLKISAAFLSQVMERAQGNPFYIEELLNFLKENSLGKTGQELTDNFDLPSSLHSLILSRIDRLDENQKIILKVASIIGRLFPMPWLWGVDPGIGFEEMVHAQLQRLSSLDLVPAEDPNPEENYLFKHIVTREVAYGSLPFATREQLHGNLGEFLEDYYTGAHEQVLDLLAYHFDLSQAEDKKREYLQKAGEAAQAAFANQAAINYYRRLLPLLPPADQGQVLYQLGQVLELVGEWPEAGEKYRLAMEAALQNEQADLLVDCQQALGILLRKQGEYAAAASALEQAAQGYARQEKYAGVCMVLAELGEVHRMQGSYAEAHQRYQESLELAEKVENLQERRSARSTVLKAAGSLANQQGNPELARAYFQESLEIRRALEDRYGVAVLLNNLGMVAMFQEDFAAAQPLFEESLKLLKEIGARWAVAQLLNNTGLVFRYRGDNARARSLLEESVAVRRLLGDKWGTANSLSSLTNLLLHAGELEGVPGMLEESLRTNHELGDKTAIAYSLEDYAGFAAATGRPQQAVLLAGAADALREAIGGPLPAGEKAALDRLLSAAAAALSEEEKQHHWDRGREMDLEDAIQQALTLPG